MSGKDSRSSSFRFVRGRWAVLCLVVAIPLAALLLRSLWGPEAARAGGPGILGTITGSRPTADQPAASGTQAQPQAASTARLPAASSETGTAPTAQKEQPQVVAVVNREPITREELKKECLRHYGEEVLESIVNKYLIMEECQRRGIMVTTEEVDAEIARMATRFGIPVETWFKLLKDERGIKPDQYKRDIIWPMLALRKLAGDRLLVAEEELRREFESRYGPAVKARMIVVSKRETAEAIRAEAAANPDQFGELAKKFSEDAPSASLKGLIQPIRKHVGQKEIEEIAFALKPGEVSQVISIANQYIILKCEDQLPPAKVRFEDVKGEIEELAKDSKMRVIAQEIFRDLQSKAQIVNVFNDPQKRMQMPDVAALINNRPVRLEDLGEMCIDRHGEEVLENLISRKLIEQACRKRNIQVTEADVNAEIERAARENLPLLPDGRADVERWMQLVTQQQGIKPEIYRNSIVWPAVALKKLVGENVSVSEDDVQKAFEANYGPRVRCRAIVLNNLRRAQQVWDKARANPTEEHFADLAEEYSVDPATRALRGEIAPIQKHGGQPLLEQEAFSLKPGEISGIIQVAPETYVILYCLGLTKPVDVDLASVRQLLVEDLKAKKIRLAMAELYDKIRSEATIDNYLAGTTQSPNLSRAAGRPSGTNTR